MLLSVEHHHRFAIAVLLVARHAVLGHQRLDPVLARPDPGAAAVDPVPSSLYLGERAAADPITGLQQRHGLPACLSRNAAVSPAKSRPDHAIIYVRHNCYGPLQIASKSRFVISYWQIPIPRATPKLADDPRDRLERDLQPARPVTRLVGGLVHRLVEFVGLE